MRSSSFAVGLTFYYWSHYKDLTTFEHTGQDYENVNDHSGHSIKDLFITRKHPTFKEDSDTNTSWIKEKWLSCSDEIKTKYNMSPYRVSYQNGKTSDGKYVTDLIDIAKR